MIFSYKLNDRTEFICYYIDKPVGSILHVTTSKKKDSLTSRRLPLKEAKRIADIRLYAADAAECEER